MAVIALTVLSLALLAALIYREWATSRERQALLDRIQFPAVAQAHAIEAALAPLKAEEPQDIYSEEVPLDGDLRFDDLLRSS